MKVVTIAGVRGSSQTTLIRDLIARPAALGKKSTIIFTGEGEDNYSPILLEVHGVKIFRLSGG